ncbi:MAG: hypothetical protein ACRET2_03685 [Steroidobacteraceae bacterium]
MSLPLSAERLAEIRRVIVASQLSGSMAVLDPRRLERADYWLDRLDAPSAGASVR